MMIFAEVNSGRSDLASASPTKDETPGSAGIPPQEGWASTMIRISVMSSMA